jgi:hypothetical protein
MNEIRPVETPFRIAEEVLNIIAFIFLVGLIARMLVAAS